MPTIYQVKCPLCGRHSAQIPIPYEGSLCKSCDVAVSQGRSGGVRNPHRVTVNYRNECVCGLYKPLARKRCDVCAGRAFEPLYRHEWEQTSADKSALNFWLESRRVRSKSCPL